MPPRGRKRGSGHGGARESPPEGNNIGRGGALDIERLEIGQDSHRADTGSGSGGGRGGSFRGRGGSDLERGGGRGRGDGGGRGGSGGGPGSYRDRVVGDRGRGGSFGRRGGGPAAPRVLAPNPAPTTGAPGPKIAPGVVTIGVRRPGARGTLGRPLTVTTNNFALTIPQATIHHYDVDIKGTDKEMPARFNQDLILILQTRIAPAVFTPRVAYDGRKNIFASRELTLSAMLMNIDISTGAMYTPGPMIPICQAIIGNPSANALVPDQGLNDRDRLTLQRFLANVRFTTSHKDKNGRVSDRPQGLKKITNLSAANYKFKLSDGNETTVAQYFRTLGVQLRYPDYVCIETGKGAAFPIELCSIIPGQMMRRQVPSHLTKNFLDFSTKRPDQRLESIMAGHSVLQYGQSEYMRQFGMTVSQSPESCLARVLPTPTLNCGPGSRLKQITPANGSWNMQHQKLFKPATVTEWALVVYDGRNIRQPEVDAIIMGLKSQADLLGIKEFNSDPPVSFPPAQSLSVHRHLQAAGAQVFQQTNAPPNLIVVVMPDNCGDLYQAVKHFGDVKRGVATQCLIGYKAKKGSPQYYANVILKINSKLGGTNNILSPTTHKFLSNVANPAMIIGSKIMHPASGAYGRPSFPAVVGSLDSHATHYAAVSGPQVSRVGVIVDLENMIYELISRHAWWKAHQEYKESVYPKRIVFYRGGVPAGQFIDVIKHELKAIKDACKRHGINPSITIIVVGKLHHERFFPTHGMGDQSGNCPAGTVIDNVVGHASLNLSACWSKTDDCWQPHLFDFYLQSHSPSVGTSRSALYSVLHDENNFTQDDLQTFTFALCHLNARATRSISVPAPLHYADIVSRRSKIHFDPSVNYASIDDEVATTSAGDPSANTKFKDLYKPTHESMRFKMYFM
ncbi:Piwi-domain-containing protein [Ceratobasidium sp. AG-I]|nr:Piwi-domain-containing protein [Ceratobasidium sp. AG-I]